MTTFPIHCARALRDGGIDAIAALNSALAEALVGLPEGDQRELKHVIGHLMGAILEATVNPAAREFPELNPDDATWQAVVKARAAARATP